MSNIYDMSGKKKVLFTKEPKTKLTYKEIMTIIIKHATEEVCHQIFCDGGVNLCPSDIFGEDKIDKEKQDDICNYNNIGCTKCWENAIKLLEERN